MELRSLTEIKTYALGGMRISDLNEAKKYSADGIAGISSFMDQ
jgi:thiamine monophosphate synthase